MDGPWRHGHGEGRRHHHDRLPIRAGYQHPADVLPAVLGRIAGPKPAMAGLNKNQRASGPLSSQIFLPSCPASMHDIFGSMSSSPLLTPEPARSVASLPESVHSLASFSRAYNNPLIVRLLRKDAGRGRRPPYE